MEGTNIVKDLWDKVNDLSHGIDVDRDVKKEQDLDLEENSLKFKLQFNFNGTT